MDFLLILYKTKENPLLPYVWISHRKCVHFVFNIGQNCSFMFRVFCLHIYVVQHCFHQGSPTLFRTCVQQKQCLGERKQQNKMPTTKHDANHTDSNKQTTTTTREREQSCTYLVKFLPLAPTAEVCASPTNNNTTFDILDRDTQPWQSTFSMVTCV